MLENDNPFERMVQIFTREYCAENIFQDSSGWLTVILGGLEGFLSLLSIKAGVGVGSELLHYHEPILKDLEFPGMIFLTFHLRFFWLFVYITGHQGLF